MKRYTIFIYSLLLFTLAAVGICPVQAQQRQSHQYALYNYRNDGDFNAWLNIDIDSITYSRIDTLGVEHDDVVVQEVWTSDSLYRIPLEAIDSIGFRTPEPVYKDNIFHIRKYHMPFILEAEGLSLTISRTIDKDSIPVVGQIIISDVIEEPLPRGFSGRVLSIESTPNSYVITCEAVALTDIFERLLLVGRSESFTTEEMQQARRSSPDDTDWDGIIPFEVGKFSVNIPSIEGFVSNSKSDMTLGTISITPKFCVSYIADIRPFVHSHVKVLFENKSKASTEMHLKVSGESSFTDTKKARVYLTKIPIPLVTGVLYGEVAVSGDLYLKGNIDLKATFTKDIYNGDEFEWSTSDFWNINHKRYDKDPKKENKSDENNGNEWQSEVTLSVNGSFGFGASLDLVLFAVSENTLEIANTTTVGPELSGSLKFSSEGLEDGTLYSTLKNTNVSFTPLKLSDDVTFNICGREFTLGSFSKDFGTKEFKLFPDFEPLSLPQYYTQGDETNLPLGLYTVVKNDVIPIIPLKLGIGRYDANDKLLDEHFTTDFYQYEDEWDNRKLYYDMSYIPTGETYTFHPLIRVWGLKALQLKAMPKTVIKIPSALSLSSASLKLTKGSVQEVTIYDGWGDFEVLSYNQSVASAIIVTHNHPDGSASKGVEIKAKAVGDAEIRVIDKRSRMGASVFVKVTDTPVNQSTIYVNTKTIDFGTVKENETKTEYFSVVNSGDYDLKFTVGRATAPFNIPEAGEEFTLAAGDTKVFAVTCSGLKSDDGTKTQFIPISSDASNASADFGITLTAKCETPAGNEAYALFNNETLTFYYDGERTLKDGKTYDLPGVEEKPDWCGKSTIKRVVFDASFASYKSLTSTQEWFHNCRQLTEIQGIENLNTSNVTDMSFMFSLCENLTSLDVSHFDTRNVTDMSSMFFFCGHLTSLDVSHFDTSNVTDMGLMFSNCVNLTSLDVSHFDTSNVTDMSDMFNYCSSLTSLDVSHFDTRRVTKMAHMFFHCSSLTGLDLSHFDTSGVTYMANMFSYCSSLTGLDLSHFDTSGVTDMRNMFTLCTSLKSLDVSSFDTKNVRYADFMFSGCTSLESLDVSHFDTENMDFMRGMFQGCRCLTSLDLSSFNTKNVRDMFIMFKDCEQLNTIFVGSEWDASSLDDDIPDSSNNLFDGCTSLVGGKGTKYDSNHTDAEYARIDGGSESPGYFTGVNASAGSVLTITPTEIDFGVVELGTNENKAITVTNTGSGTLTFTAYSDPSFTKFFKMSDSGVEFTLEPGTTKDLTITCHGIETGNRASSNIVVISNAEENTKYVKLTVVGTDSEPLVETSSLNLSVKEEKILAVRTEGFEFINNNPEIVKATRGGSTTGGGGGELGDYDFQSYYSFGTGHLVIEAIAAGIATVKITDKATGKEDILTVTVSSSSTDVPAEAVDLGLPSGTKWASYNVGATKPEEFGGYYAWGETEVKDSYTNDNYQYKDTYQELGRNICFTDYDVAHVKWGDAWRMPTGTEFNELWNNCSHTWTTVNGVNGMRLTGSNGNSIFLPAAGNYYESLVNEANFGFYRAGTYTSSSFFEPDYFTFDSSGINGIGDCFGTEGLSVRPVLDSRGAPIIRVFPQEIDFGVVKQGTDKTKTFKVTNVSNANVTFHIDGSSQFSYRFEVSDNKVSCTLAPGESREFTVTCHGMEATCEAFTSILVKSDTNDEEYKVSLSAVGDDDTPLIDETSMTLAVGERGFVTVNTMSYHISTEDGQIVYWEEFGYSKETKLEDGYDSKEKNGYAKPAFIAKRAGAAVVTFTNKDASKTAVLTITVTDASTSY